MVLRAGAPGRRPGSQSLNPRVPRASLRARVPRVGSQGLGVMAPKVGSQSLGPWNGPDDGKAVIN